MGLAKYVVRRAIYMIPLVIGISIVSFFVMYAAGNPIQIATMGNPSITEAQRQFLRNYNGLNDPIPVQYLITSFMETLACPFTVEDLSIRSSALSSGRPQSYNYSP